MLRIFMSEIILDETLPLQIYLHLLQFFVDSIKQTKQVIIKVRQYIFWKTFYNKWLIQEQIWSPVYNRVQQNPLPA